MIGNRFVLEQRLREGRSGGVWRARNADLGSCVALKLLQRPFPTPDAVERLRREARTEASLQQPGVVRVFDVQTHQGDTFIAMELLEGQTLAALLAQRGRIEATEAVRLLLPVIAVLASVHARGMVHGNLDATNIILVPLGDELRPTLVDFGDGELTSAVGTYSDDGAADVSAVCHILREAVAGPGLEDILDQRLGTMQELGVSLARFLLAQGVKTDASGAEVAEAWLRAKRLASRTTVALRTPIAAGASSMM